MPDEHSRPVEAASAPRPGEPAGSALITGSAPRRKSPLITAVEIENFKGIGPPVRIDLRPITLLFGRNSAGKSTVIQALCYAHEILCHGNVDAVKTEIGGDQIDVGGFRNFVHAHDLERDVRLRFELNLGDWSVPAGLREKMKPSEPVESDPADEEESVYYDEPTEEEWIYSDGPTESVRSGWVQLAIAWRRLAGKPVIASYEVGVNGSLVGRIVRTGSLEASVKLEFNWSHPLFIPLGGGQPAESYAAAGHVRETPEPHGDQWRLHRASVFGPSPLPDWNELLALGLVPDDLSYNNHVEVGGFGSCDFPMFQATVSGALVGIGHTLRDELAALRYIGPVRKLRPRTHVESGSPEQESWSDGSAAWNLLRHPDPSLRAGRGLIDDVNDWLARDDRLDTGYKLRRQSTVELPTDAHPVHQIRFLDLLPTEYRNEDGNIDPDQWVRREAAKIVDLAGGNREDVEARIKARHANENQPVDIDSSNQDDSTAASIIEPKRGIYRLLTEFVAVVKELDKGGSAVRDLVRAIAAAPLRTTLQLVTVGADLPVRTSDIGIGISQILPVVAAALDPQRPGITAIEQPELHTHPKLQVELGDLFAQPVDDGRVFLLENHSEHLMLRLLRRIEETHSGELPEGKPPLKPDQVSVVFVEQIDGEVRATPLRIDKTGEFVDRWPHGFFDERDDELF